MTSLPPLAVLDSSVLVPIWSRFVLQRLAARPLPSFTPVWSEWIIAETWRVLPWRWLVRTGRPDAAEWRALSAAACLMLRQLLPVMTLISLQNAGTTPCRLSGNRDAPAGRSKPADQLVIVGMRTNPDPQHAVVTQVAEGTVMPADPY